MNCINIAEECGNSQEVINQKYKAYTKECYSIKYQAEEEIKKTYTDKHECRQTKYTESTQCVWKPGYVEKQCRKTQCNAGNKECKMVKYQSYEDKKDFVQCNVDTKECKTSECLVEYNKECKTGNCRQIMKECKNVQCQPVETECKQINCVQKMPKGYYQCDNCADHLSGRQCTVSGRNNKIPKTTVPNISEENEVLAADYNALSAAFDKLKQYAGKVDNCGFAEPSQCRQHCQSCQWVKYVDCIEDVRWQQCKLQCGWQCAECSTSSRHLEQCMGQCKNCNFHVGEVECHIIYASHKKECIQCWLKDALKECAWAYRCQYWDGHTECYDGGKSVCMSGNIVKVINY